MRKIVALTLCGVLSAPAFAAEPVPASAASAPASGVSESTDPGRAAAIERRAREMKAQAAAAASQPGGSAYVVEGRTEGGLAFLSGGVTKDDRSRMYAKRGDYNLWVATVAKPSGAYLTDVELRIVDASTQAQVLNRRMDGPWFMLALPAGQYDVSGTFHRFHSAADQTLSMRVNVAASGQRQAVLRFDSTAEVGDEAERPAQGNPFGAPKR